MIMNCIAINTRTQACIVCFPDAPEPHFMQINFPLLYFMLIFLGINAGGKCGRLRIPFETVAAVNPSATVLYILLPTCGK